MHNFGKAAKGAYTFLYLFSYTKSQASALSETKGLLKCYFTRKSSTSLPKKEAQNNFAYVTGHFNQIYTVSDSSFEQLVHFVTLSSLANRRQQLSGNPFPTQSGLGNRNGNRIVILPGFVNSAVFLKIIWVMFSAGVTTINVW